jgi:uncharacterized small protein (DUF1192 family)
MTRTRRGTLQDHHARGERDGRADKNSPPHGWWRSLASALGLLTKRDSRSQRMSNRAYQAGRKIGKGGWPRAGSRGCWRLYAGSPKAAWRHPFRDDAMTSPQLHEQQWLDVSEATAMTGLDREAIQSLAKRGLIPHRTDDQGRWLVQIPPGSVTMDDRTRSAVSNTVLSETVTALQTEVAVLREELARTRAERDAAVEVSSRSAGAAG